MFKKKEKNNGFIGLGFSRIVHIPENPNSEKAKNEYDKVFEDFILPFFLRSVFIPEIPNFTKFKVIEHKQYFYGLTFCEDSTTEYIFEDLLPAEGYIKRRMDSFPEYRKKFLKKFNGIVGVSFSIVPIYANRETK